MPSLLGCCRISQVCRRLAADCVSDEAAKRAQLQRSCQPVTESVKVSKFELACCEKVAMSKPTTSSSALRAAVVAAAAKPDAPRSQRTVASLFAASASASAATTSTSETSATVPDGLRALC